MTTGLTLRMKLLHIKSEIMSTFTCVEELTPFSVRRKTCTGQRGNDEIRCSDATPTMMARNMPA